MSLVWGFLGHQQEWKGILWETHKPKLGSGSQSLGAVCGSASPALCGAALGQVISPLWTGVGEWG